MKRCDWAGAGMVLFIWVVAIAVAHAFERQLGEAGGVLILILGFVGVWAGYEVRRQCGNAGGAK